MKFVLNPSHDLFLSSSCLSPLLPSLRLSSSAANFRCLSQPPAMKSSTASTELSGEIEGSLKSKEQKLWGGRFEENVTEAVERFTESVSFDKELYKHDIMGSKAHATMLAHQVPHSFFLIFYLISGDRTVLGFVNRYDERTDGILRRFVVFLQMM